MLVLALVTACRHSSPGEPDRAELLVFAAASLSDVMPPLAARYSRSHPVSIHINVGGSNQLARQILATSRADLFVSASPGWMDHVAQAGKLAPGTRRDLLQNQLVVIGHKGDYQPITSIVALARLPGPLVLADPSAVPAGQYARAYLSGVPLGDATLWQALASRVIPMPDVRAALHLVQARVQSLGIVYHSDLHTASSIDILYRVPIDQAPAIRYVAAALAGRPHLAQARLFLDWLGQPEAAAIFAAAGFLPIAAAAPHGDLPHP